MSYLFLRYLYEQAADKSGFISGLLATDKTGVGNVEDALESSATPFSEFTESFSYWQVALVMTDTGLTNDPRYIYQEREIDEVTGNYTGICMKCDANDGRGTILNGPVISKAGQLPLTVDLLSAGAGFVEIEAPGSQLSISGSSGVLLGGALIRLETN